ncbi:MAG: zinc metallopeptidase, partial [Methanomicrobiales archaeon]|nr:zinc metallopeptidase [Methanomicrobiales archaeon]
MRWQEGRRSTNVEDRRGQIVKGGAIGGAGIIVLLLIAVLMGADPGALLNTITTEGGSYYDGGTTGTVSAEEAQLADMVSVVLADTEDAWRVIFRENGAVYREPTLVLFSGGAESACGYAQSATGPFYCPADEKVYIDLSFYQELKDQFGAPGDFAQAYVIAHEVGHHVQNQFGILDQVTAIQRRSDEVTANRYSVMLELQADCYAGVWANRADRARNIIEEGDVEEALNAASKIGDDNLQKQTQGYVVPDSFTHGTSAQRMQWFRTGLSSGDINSCDTFSGSVI